MLVHGGEVTGGFVGGEVFVGDGAGGGGEGVLFVVGEGGADDLFGGRCMVGMSQRLMDVFILFETDVLESLL